MARHRAPRRRGWLPALAAPAAPSLPVPRLSVENPPTSGRVAASGVLAVAALGGTLAATDGLDAMEDTVSDTLSRVATVSSRSPVTSPLTTEALAEPVPPEPAVFELDSLLKGVAAAEREALARSARQAEVAGRTCAEGTSGFGAVKSWVASAGEELRCRFGVGTVYGLAARAGTSDHPSGLALDFMVDRTTGDRLADYALRNRDRLGITYVIYRQRINFGTGWQTMEDRGGPTANHFDHVHISFRRRPASAPSQA